MLLNILSFTSGFSQTEGAAATTSALPVSVNTILCYIAVFTIVYYYRSGNDVKQCQSIYINNIKETEKKDVTVIKGISILIGLVLLTQFAFSQTAFSPDPAVTAAAVAKAAASTAVWEGKFLFYGLILLIIVEAAIILFFIRTLSFLTGIDKFRKSQIKDKKEKTIWETINQFKPLEEEGNMDTGHNYDGIRELDNITPPWFIAGFAATILFAAVYLYRYDIAHSAPNQLSKNTPWKCMTHKYYKILY